MAYHLNSPKQELIDKALHNPINFTDEDFNALVSLVGAEALDFTDIREMIKRIYSINNTILLDNSTEAFKLPLGPLNALSTCFRMRKFNNRVKNRPDDKRINILAEGDSWFQLPVGVNDIIGWLFKKNPNYAIYSIAYGGNWITNIIYDGNYVAELPVLDPHYFLISGGGNDLVGDNRVAIMVQNPDSGKGVGPGQLKVTDYITKEFFAFVIAIKLQYFMMFRNIQKAFENTIILTQGYDYGIPSYSKRWSWRYPQQYVVNLATDTGCWLKRPLDIKKIPADIQAQIIRFFIDKINEMYISLAQSGKFPNLYHIDCRGTAQDHQDWFDELHLKPYKFKVVAHTYQKFMNGDIERQQPELWREIMEKKTFKVTAVK